MKIEKPIAFIDLETTGKNPSEDRIVEIAICKRHPDGSREVYHKRVNPAKLISDAATAVHGILNADVENEPTFQQIADEVYSFIAGCDIAGYNSNNFDIPMLYCEFLRSFIVWDYKENAIIDVCNIFRQKESRSLSAAVRFYCGHELENAHNAEADILATVDVFEGQLQMYPDLPETMEDLQKFCNNGKQLLDVSGRFTYDDDGEIVFAFGKYSGQKAKQNLDYVKWMLFKAATFNPDTEAVCRKLLGIPEPQSPAP